jgi:YggT family protein
MILGLLCLVLDVYFIVLIVRIILSWVPSLPEPVEPLARFVRALTDPLLLPLRQVIPPIRLGMGALDLSPLVLFFGISLLQSLLCA